MQRIIAIEASTDAASVALLCGGNITQQHFGAGSRQSERMLVGIDELLRQAGLAPSALDAVAVAIGPGAFTGVRLAIGVAQGLAAAIGKPVVPVSSLAALAASIPADAPSVPVLAVLDARMGEIYAGWFDSADGMPTLLTPESIGTADTLVKPTGLTRYAALGSGLREHVDAIAAALGEPAAAFPDLVPTAAAVARIAARRLPGAGVSAAEVEPVYLRNKVALTTAEREAARS
jgi:tRNA threonylcarbamoyladenosine biosynthesis protein TsaB